MLISRREINIKFFNKIKIYVYTFFNIHIYISLDSFFIADNDTNLMGML